jgi:small subunit ribosomal protein S8e
MVITHRAGRGRKPTGGRYTTRRSKRAYDSGNQPAATTISEKVKIKVVRVRGGNVKVHVQRATVANVLDQKSGKFSQSKIKTVIDNPANRHFVRQNVITKGTVIETEKGKARVTSRPGQDGTVNAVLI